MANLSICSTKVSSPKRLFNSASDKFLILPNSNKYMFDRKEQIFVITVFVASIILAFLFGYLVFRYEKLEICRTEIEVLPEINPGAKS